ncbi:hypothetical protein QCA50_016755 [Cerrena zonata]|uniref:Uncharacterized protein n=1 Tax=Cerrena zonata TaxID=2478898 RepID=A0AAW0FHK0_9APHY
MDQSHELTADVFAAPPPPQIQFDEGNVQRPPNANRPIWFTNSDNPIKSNEAAGVWFRGGIAYKIYTTQNTMNKVVPDLATARANNLPIGNANSAVGLVSICPQTQVPFRAKAGFVVRTTDYRVGWQFFTAQGSAEVAKFRGIINGISNRATLTSIQSALQIAVRLRLADPQGFINPNDASPIQFIDIHYGSDASGQLLDIVNQRLNSL